MSQVQSKTVRDLPFKLQKDEKILRICHRHNVFLMRQLGVFSIGGAILVLIGFIIAGSLQNDFLRSIVHGASIIGIFAVLIYTGFRVYQYNNDIWVITNQRLIDSSKSTPFNHKLSSTDLVNVQDMSIEKNGILATSFNYGDLRCQTAGMDSNFTLFGIPEPAEVLELIDGARDRARAQHSQPR